MSYETVLRRFYKKCYKMDDQAAQVTWARIARMMRDAINEDAEHEEKVHREIMDELGDD